MKWINAEQQVTVTIYDEEHEEHLDKVMTVEEMLDTYTNEGCPTIYSNPEQTGTGWTGIEDDYPVSIKAVLNITAETGALDKFNFRTSDEMRVFMKEYNPDRSVVSSTQRYMS